MTDASEGSKKKRKIAQLRALAASTTFPEEAASARAKADELEASLPQESDWLEGMSTAELMREINEALDKIRQQGGFHVHSHAADAFAYAMGSNPYAEARTRQQENERIMRERWQRMFDEAMGRKRG